MGLQAIMKANASRRSVHIDPFREITTVIGQTAGGHNSRTQRPRRDTQSMVICGRLTLSSDVLVGSPERGRQLCITELTL